VKQITYIDTVVRTDDDVADLVIEYAMVLAHHATSDVVTIPAIGADDRVRPTTLLIGPASQLVVTTVDSPPRPDLDAAAAVAHLRGRIAFLERKPVVTEQVPGDEEFYGDGLL
jgi:hypothetical protein